MQEIYWAKLQLVDWQVYSAATETGLCYIGSPGASFEELKTWVQKCFNNVQLIESKVTFELYQDELNEYLNEKRRDFTLPLDLYGTAFQLKVWEILQAIPYGEVVSYMDIAERLGNPGAVRAVGSAIGANPVLIVVPCHRVITKGGKLGGFRAGLAMKKQLLALEADALKIGKEHQIGEAT